MHHEDDVIPFTGDASVLATMLGKGLAMESAFKIATGRTFGSHSQDFAHMRAAILAAADAGLAALRLDPLDADQRACLFDTEREAEARDMIDDLRVRVGLPDPIAVLLLALVTDAGEPDEPNDCPECARSNGPNFTGPCIH